MKFSKIGKIFTDSTFRFREQINVKLSKIGKIFTDSTFPDQ